MSCEQELSGEYQLSSKAWSEFKKNLIAKLKESEERAYNALISSYDKLKLLAKDKDAIKVMNGTRNDRFFDIDDVWEEAWSIAGEEARKILKSDDRVFPPCVSIATTSKGVRMKVVKPTKKAVKDALRISLDKRNGLIGLDDGGDTSVILCDKKRVAKIHIESGSRSVRNAQFNSLLYRFYFASFPIEWSSKTGGYCTMLEEDMSDDYSSRNMIKSICNPLGPLGEEALRRQHALHNAMMKNHY